MLALIHPEPTSHTALAVMTLGFLEKLFVGIVSSQIKHDVMRRDLMFDHQFIAQFVKFVFRTRDEHKIAFFRCQFSGKSLADSARRTRDKRNFHNPFPIRIILRKKIYSVKRVI